MTGQRVRLAIEWTEQAVRQVDQARGSIALTNGPDMSDRIAMQIVASVEQLATFPISGRIGRVAGSRELVISQTPFIAAYAIHQKRAVVLAIYHGARQWPESF